LTALAVATGTDPEIWFRQDDDRVIATAIDLVFGEGKDRGR
jgi:hypothetical protein